MTIEKFSIWRYGYPSKYLLGIRHDGFWGKQKLFRQKVWRIIIVLLLFPVFIFDLIIGEVFRGRAIFKRQVDPLLKDIIIKHKLILLKKMGVKNIAKYGDINELDFFRVIQHYTYEESKTHQPKMQNYVALYGFLRTTSFLLVIIFWTYIFHCFNNVHIKYAFSLLIIPLISIVGYIFYLGFIKFYRRYTLEGYMALISIQKLSTTPNTQLQNIG
jgi:hypothetical protein